MHNNIMAAGSKDRPPMLGPGRFSQWRSRFLRYIDTKANGEGLRKSILTSPYVPLTILVQAVAATEGNPAIQQHTTIETVLNMTPENKEHFLSEKEAILLLLTGIGDDIYSTIDACKTANEMWIDIKRLQQVSDEDNDLEQAQKDKDMHFAKEYRKPKRVKDFTYRKEKMLLCKQAETGVPLQAEQANWLEDMDEEIDEQELEAHYSFMANIKEVLLDDSSSTDTPLEQLQNDDEYNVFANERQHSEQPESINDTHVLEKDDCYVIPDSSNMCNNDNQVD
ncbi:hypothetical protein Tco_0251550 [Tanacetum coccineum]